MLVLVDLLLADCIDANRIKSRKCREFLCNVSSGEEVTGELGRAFELLCEVVSEHRGGFVVDDAEGTVSGVSGNEVDLSFPHDCDRTEAFNRNLSERY